MALQNPGLPRVLNRVTPSRLEAMLVILKERKKRVSYMGSYLLHYSDRNHWYNNTGGVNGTKFIVEETHGRAQFNPPGTYHGVYSIRSVKTKGSQYDMMGGYTRSTWDQQIYATNMFDVHLKRLARKVPRDMAINLMECLGVKYILLDDVRKPSIQNSHYIRHKIYADKFSWVRDPTTNESVGDADWGWRGDEKLDYSVYGANAAPGRKNEFRSLWGIPQSTVVHHPALASTSATAKK